MSSRPKLTIKKRRKPSVIKSDNSSSSSSSSEIEQNSYSQKTQKSKNEYKPSSPKKYKKSTEKLSVPNLPNYPTKNIYKPELFIDNVIDIKRFKCGLCERICENPRYQYCGCSQIYCKDCLNIYYERYHHQCPKCQKETKELIPEKSCFESLNNLKMKCINENLKCPWTGLYIDYKHHIMNDCLKEIINCPNKGCIIKMRREGIQKHKNKCEYRLTLCRDCLSQITVSEKKIHKNYCPKAKIMCPQGCGESIEREDFTNHKKKCKNSNISCPYKSFGCRDKYPRNQKDERMVTDVHKHLDLTAKVILELQKKINDMQKEINELKNNKVDKKDNENNNIILNMSI